LETTSKHFEVKFAEIYEKCEKFDSETKRLSDVKADKDELKDMVDKINNLLKEVEEALKWKQPVVQITNRIDKVEIQIQQLLNGLGKGGGVDSAIIKDLEDKLQLLRDDFEKFKEDVMGWLKDLQDALENKADLTSLKDLERELLSRLEDLANGLDKRFADKNETKKALKALEKQIKSLFDLIMNQEGRQGGEDDAMFAKKPLGGWSCASCARDLINLQGMPADYVPWSRWPLRDPNERLAKSGQGFSRILAKMKPEYANQPNFYPHGTIDEEQYNHIQPSDKFTIKKKKKSRPMSAARPGQTR
jgi:DNA repair exonuclease SbcCD ATPase subunit